MIEILLKNKTVVRVQSTDEIIKPGLDFHIIQFIDFTKTELDWIEENFALDFSIMYNFEDIEISSHFLESEKQAAFHFSIPFYNQEKTLVEEPVFFIMSNEGLFMFCSSKLDEFFNKAYSKKVSSIHEMADLHQIFKSQFEFISDYYADIIEHLSKQIMLLANRVLIERKFAHDEMDDITTFNFNNLMVKESLIETTHLFKLFKKSKWGKQIAIKECIESELTDLTAVSDYIQFNFDRLDDLKENVSSKIDLEQNHIFKVLTIVTVCISLPTLIAGIYGMNFQQIPGTTSAYGFPITLLIMVLSAAIPIVYFKRRKWL